MNAQHTPTPWTADTSNNRNQPRIIAPDSYQVARVTNRDDLAFIVRACNSHEALVAALKTVRDLIHEESSDRARRILGPNDDAEPYLRVRGAIEAYRAIRAALAQAGEGA